MSRAGDGHIGAGLSLCHPVPPVFQYLTSSRGCLRADSYR
jgi:hypothetical protein